MEPVVEGAHARLEHVGVDLRRGQIRVPEHHLDGPQIRTAIEEVRRK